jgi:hypothetical protein
VPQIKSALRCEEGDGAEGHTLCLCIATSDLQLSGC